MSLLSSRVGLTHRCTIERNANTSVDSWGGQADPDWQPHLIDQPCRVWTTAGREQVTDTTTVVVVEDMRLLLPLNADVTEQDRLALVTYRGDSVVVGPVQIRAVLRHPTHLELVLVKDA